MYNDALSFRVISTVETVPMRLRGATGDEGLQVSFRIELRQQGCAGPLVPRVWRLESFRIQSTFPQDRNGDPLDEPSDETLLIEEETLDFSDISGNSPEVVVNQVIERILERFQPEPN